MNGANTRVVDRLNFAPRVTQISAGIQQRDQFITPPGYAPVVADHSYFFTRRIYTPMRDCWDRPIDSAWFFAGFFLLF